MTALYIGIDCGTQGTKAVLLKQGSSQIIAEAYKEHSLEEDAQGKREQDPLMWVEAVKHVIGQVIQKSAINPREIKGIGVSGQQHGMVALDKKDRVIRPAKLWCDTSTTKQAEALTQKLGGEKAVIDCIGNSIAVGFTASKLLWLKENEPENYQNLTTVLLPHDYINFWLTGQKVAEIGDASGTAYFDVRKREWSQKVINSIDSSGQLLACLPPLATYNEGIGFVRSEVAAIFGLSADVLVSPGGGDNMMAAIGTGNVASGVVTASIGTSGTIYGFSETPVVDAQGEVAAFCSSEGHWLPLVCTMNATVSSELTRNLLNKSLLEFNALLESAPVGAEGVVCLPFFNGERTPALPQGKASFHGIDSSNFTPSNMCRASVEGASYGLRYGLDALKRNDLNPRQVRLTGGGSKSKVWREVIANVFECEVVSPIIEEAGAWGAALQALWCQQNQTNKVSIKEITDEYVSLNQESRVVPDEKKSEQYQENYQNYLSLVQQMYPKLSNKQES